MRRGRDARARLALSWLRRMSDAALPPLLELLARRPFSFYPAIRNVEHNEWLMKKATWSEIQVSNTKTGMELWVPRQYVGEVSSVDQPVMILGLLRELEYKAGTVWPHDRRLLEMPSTSGQRAAAAEPGVTPHAAPRRSDPTESRIGRLVVAGIGGALLLFVLIVAVFRAGPLRSRLVYTAKDQSFLELSRYDDYHAVVRKLGAPAQDRWRSETGELQYRLLWYPQRAYFVVLMGADRDSARYVGSLDANWHVIHYAELPGGGNTASLLRALPKF